MRSWYVDTDFQFKNPHKTFSQVTSEIVWWSIKLFFIAPLFVLSMIATVAFWLTWWWTLPTDTLFSNPYFLGGIASTIVCCTIKMTVAGYPKDEDSLSTLGILMLVVYALIAHSTGII